MDLQGIVDMIEPMACIISVEKFSDGSYGNIRLAAGNKAYVESIENKDTISSSQMLKNKFIPNSPYEDYIPKDLNFEDACYHSAVLKEIHHSYIHPDRYSFWIDLYMIPLAVERENTSYCIYIQEFTVKENSERMLNLSAETSSAVLKTCIKLKGSKDFESSVDEVLSDLREMCDAERCSILLKDDKKRECSVFKYSVSPDLELPPLSERVEQARQQDDADFFDIVETWQDTIAGSSCLIIKDDKDMAVLKERNPLWHGSLLGAGIRTLVLFPLIYNGELVGYIWAVNFNTDNTVNIKEILELTSRLIAAEIANYQMMNRLKEMGTVDMLTGLLNRNAMNNRIDHFKKPDCFGVILADLNGLKQKNDMEGHVAGDALLKAAAEKLSAVFRDAEIYRAGGDEFMVIAPDVPEEDLKVRVEKLRRDSEDPENISFALGLYYDDGEGDILKAMRIADERMYMDKERYYKLFPERKRK